MFLLDSSAIIEILKGTKIGEKIAKDLDKKELATTVFSLYEILMGSKLNEIEKIDSFFQDLEILHFDSLAARESSLIEKELIKKGNLINKIDVFIASICKLNNATLVTKDKDFKKILDIKVILV